VIQDILAVALGLGLLLLVASLTNFLGTLLLIGVLETLSEIDDAVREITRRYL